MTHYKITVNGKHWDATVVARKAQSITFEIDEVEYTVTVQPVLDLPGFTGKNPDVENRAGPAQAPDSSNSSMIKAPIAGFVAAIPVGPGDMVSRGQTLLTIEAMKMENAIGSPRDGKVSEVKVKLGQEVENHQVLIVLEDR